MIRIKSIYLLVVMVMFFSFPLDCVAFEIRGKTVTITYFDKNTLRTFNKKLNMGRLKSKIKGGDSIESEVAAKLEFIAAKARRVLDMFPPKFKFSVVILPGVKDVQKEFIKIYNVKVGYIAFYSPSRNRVFFSANNAVLRVVAHEIGHAVAENYFVVSPPQRIHEVLAQFAEAHISD
ncbi:MAG: hypothetical protein HOG03_19000 [Desulfobacula sp.]|jgi:predicted SprT family Zn-dependent metalloprotease|uniref:hypothetical protein n=1 Tax=Desulfobacula sp. TaxID=2593537 RepID=UPI001DBE6464|nr:hypothetical protein [Desulfobacula sp.]MBT3806659.1 hypothetical protein [Desulfobacula sp.]MBT4505947.1 hypothetical protein [Desulfobacula sp.]MBT5971021.1 hypothetical protein [Desulfobacula sp.]MBT6339193.1 hypothetical protein [Desulfobacula sp.]